MQERGVSFVVVMLIILTAAAACGRKETGHHYLIAKRIEQGPGLTLTLTLVRRFEKKNWCDAEKESMSKRDFEAECRYEELVYEPMFHGEPAGKWYALQRVGKFPPSVLIYEFDPPLPDEIILKQLRQSAPHVLKFAALHRAPAEVRIFSPEGEVL